MAIIGLRPFDIRDWLLKTGVATIIDPGDEFDGAKAEVPSVCSCMVDKEPSWLAGRRLLGKFKRTVMGKGV